MGTPPESLARALAAVDAVEAIALTRRWVEVNSYTANVDGVNRVGAMLREAFALPSLTVQSIAGGEGYGDHLVWRTSASGAPVVLVGHHDTVFPPGHFEGWRESDDARATGPGALDMKGGLAVIRGALVALEKANMLASLPVVVVSVADEEVGSPTSKPHLEAVANGARCGLVFESGRAADAIITRRKGVGAMTVTARGKAAHAGNNHKDGANAIWALARFVDAAQQLTDYTRGRTVNVGMFQGGTSKNTVPETATCMLDLRYETVADAHALVEGLRAAAGANSVAGVTLEVTRGANRLPLERTPASAALRDAYAACARAEGLGDGEAALLGGGSDANTIAPLGVPVIDGLGPRGAGFHTTTEYVELATFAPKIRALVRFLASSGCVLALVLAGCRSKPTEQSAAPVVGSAAAQPAPVATAAGSGSASSTSALPTIDAAIAHAAAAHKPLLLEFSTTWCKPCKVFEETTLVDERVQTALGGVELVRYDAEAEPGTAAAMRFSVSGYPTFIGVDEHGDARARSSGIETGDAGVHQFLGFIARVESATLGEPELKARLAATPNDAALRLAAGRWYAEHGRIAEAKTQYDAVGTSATPAERAEAAIAAARLARIARWKQELVAECLERARRLPATVDDHQLAIATIDSGVPLPAIHAAFANVFAARTDPSAVNSLLYVALAAGAVDEALAAGKRVLADTKDPQQLDTLAECYHVHGDHTDALRVEDQAIALAKSPSAGGLVENRKRFASGHGDSDDVARLHAEVARTWKQLAQLDDAEAASAQPADDESQSGPASAAMAAFGAIHKLGQTASAACASKAGNAAEAFAQVKADPSGKVIAATLYLEDGASPALRACLIAQLVGATLPVVSGFPMMPVEILFKPE